MKILPCLPTQNVYKASDGVDQFPVQGAKQESKLMTALTIWHTGGYKKEKKNTEEREKLTIALVLTAVPHKSGRKLSTYSFFQENSTCCLSGSDEVVGGPNEPTPDPAK